MQDVSPVLTNLPYAQPGMPTSAVLMLVDAAPAQSRLSAGPGLMVMIGLWLHNQCCRKEGLAQHLLADLQVLMRRAGAEVALAEGGVEHNGGLDGQQVPQQIEPLQQWQQKHVCRIPK